MNRMTEVSLQIGGIITTSFITLYPVSDDLLNKVEQRLFIDKLYWTGFCWDV